ncbi:MAG: DUF945 family protein [Gammaproteobacteria bacterium]|nr:MAG: DUF945 family protein [Gammaproteobacteria bacterium]
MRKITYLILLLFLLGILAAIPGASGFWFKKMYFDTIAAINAGHQFNIEVLDYQEGWLHSSAKIKITPILPNPPPPIPIQLEVTIDQSITHGPLVYNDINKNWQFAAATIQNDIHIPFVSQNSMQIYSLATFYDDWFTQIYIPAINKIIPGKGKITWQGLQGEVDFHVTDQTIDRTKMNMTIGAFNADTDPQIPVSFHMNIQPISYQTQASRQFDNIWNGETQSSLPGLSIQSAGKTIIDLNKLTMGCTFGAARDIFWNANFQLSLDKLSAPDQPITVISPLTITSSINNFSAQGINEILKALPNKPMAYQVFPRIIIPTSVMNNTITLSTSLGDLLLQATFSWPANTPLPASMDEITQKANINMNVKIAIPLVNLLIDNYAKKIAARSADKINAMVTERATSPVPTPTLNQAPQQRIPTLEELQQHAVNNIKQQINNWIQQGYITQENDSYIVSIIRDAGVLQINGKIPPPDFTPPPH